jgi:hypothetical protein
MQIANFPTQQSRAYKETIEFVESNSEIAKRLSNSMLVGYQILFETPPSDLESVLKVGFHPFSEATTDICYAVFHAVSGSYKSAYHHLRSFFELYLIGNFFLSPNSPRGEALEWLVGEKDTPFMSRLLDRLFKEPNFAAADRLFGFKKEISKVYGRLSSIVHNKGIPVAHQALNLSNYPRFNINAFKGFLDELHDAIGIEAAAMALRSPIILYGLPMMQKFGLNPPLCGFLEEWESTLLREFIRPDWLPFLDEIAVNDVRAQAEREFVLSRDDISSEEYEQQCREFEESTREMKKNAETSELLDLLNKNNKD